MQSSSIKIKAQGNNPKVKIYKIKRLEFPGVELNGKSHLEERAGLQTVASVLKICLSTDVYHSCCYHQKSSLRHELFLP